MGKSYRNCSSTFRKPKRPFEKERLENELKLVGQYGLKNKRETWRVLYTLAKIRKAARVLLTLDEKDEVRIFQGEFIFYSILVDYDFTLLLSVVVKNVIVKKCIRIIIKHQLYFPFHSTSGAALLRRMTRMGLLNKAENKLDYVLGLTTAKFMERRLQTKVFKLQLAKSYHHARVLIKQRHIRVGKQICDTPSFMVRVDSEKQIDFAFTSPLGGGRPGRVKRKNAGAAGEGGADEED